jgi:hypothetical protein
MLDGYEGIVDVQLLSRFWVSRVACVCSLLAHTTNIVGFCSSFILVLRVMCNHIYYRASLETYLQGSFTLICG